MGNIVRLKKGRSPGAGAQPTDYDGHIASLIGELEDLLVERKRIGQGEMGPDPHATAAAHLAAPFASSAANAGPCGFPAGRARMARELVRQRRQRADFMSASLLAEPAWDMMLDLYAAHYEGKPVAVSSLCIAANVPSTTALRSIDAMTRKGCLVRKRDPEDGRRIFITLSDGARTGLDGYFDALSA